MSKPVHLRPNGPGVLRPHPGSADCTRGSKTTDSRLCTVEPLYLFLSLKCLNRGRVRNIGDEIPWRWSLPECFASSVGSFTSTLNVRVEDTSVLRDMQATRSTPPNVEEQRKLISLFFPITIGLIVYYVCTKWRGLSVFSGELDSLLRCAVSVGEAGASYVNKWFNCTEELFLLFPPLISAIYIYIYNM